jgi:hypothetical protein
MADQAQFVERGSQFQFVERRLGEVDLVIDGENVAEARRLTGLVEASADLAESARDIAQAAVGVDYANAAAALAGASNGEKFTYWSGDEIIFATKTAGVLVTLAGPWIGGNRIAGYVTRTALKAIDAFAGAQAYLTEAGREGQFIFRAGDFSARIAADTAEGIYIKADGAASSAGAWVRTNELVFKASWFGIVPTASFDNGPNLRAARNVLELISGTWASFRLVLDFGVYEVSTAEADASAAVRFNKAPKIQGQGPLNTQIHWKTSTANQPMFLVDPVSSNACWGIEFFDFAIHARTGTAAGAGIKISMTSPSATFAFLVQRVRVAGCHNGIETANVGGTTVYGGVIRDCSVEQIINTGRGFNIGGSYVEMDNCEAYPSFDGTGNTAYAFYLTAGWSKFRNLRAAGPVYGDAPSSEIDITVEGQASDCVHNSAVVRINRMKKIRCVLLGARKTGVSTPQYGLLCQDSGYLIEYLNQQDTAGYSSPATPLILGGAEPSSLILAEASGTGVLKPESDAETGYDPTMGGKLKIMNGGTWTDFGVWSSTYDPGSIAPGDSAVTTVTCGGLRSGVIPLHANFSIVDADIDVSCKYLSATQVQVRFSNRGAGAMDLGSGTLTVSAMNVP